VMNFEPVTFATAGELSQAVARAFVDEIEAANRDGKRYCVAISGGRICHKFFPSIVEQLQSRAVSIQHVHFFWADERCVPSDDPESNHRLADELLFQPLKVAEAQIHRIRGEDLPEIAAQKAEAEIRQIASRSLKNQPVLDLILLGMGEDGHVASLFPDESEALVASPAVYRAVKNSPKPPPNRVTLGYPAIAAAQKVWVLVSGAGKERSLTDSLNASGQTSLARVLKSRSTAKIFTDVKVLRF
ncbi:MAG TPA: 6-phosphogluconolactonase, partial [Verrucomicrobiae bacterium]|nr:6-phosphogluconolactonase [Verrucomicrobiae bacterium]